MQTSSVCTHNFQSRIGRLQLEWDRDSSRLAGIRLPGSANGRAKAGGGRRSVGFSQDLPKWLQELVGQLAEYFDGRPVKFSQTCLDLEQFTPFYRRIYSQISRMSAGETMSYGGVAAAAGSPRAARAVGQAMATNPYPIVIPCHRVVASDGGRGGYSGGLDMKWYLLVLERGGADAEQ